MPITVVHNPPAATVGGLGVLAGNAAYNTNLYPQLVQQDQFGQQMQQRQNEILFNAAQQQAQQAQQEQFAAAQQAAQFQQQQKLQAQQGAYGLQQAALHGYLQDRNQQNLFAQQDNRDFNQQQARSALELQHQQSILDRRNAFEQQQAQLEEAKGWQKKFYDPFSEYDSTVGKMTQQGLQYTPEDQKRLDDIRQRITRTTGAVQNGDFHFEDVLPKFKEDVAAMNRIKPTVQKTTTAQDFAENSAPVYRKIPDPAGGVDENGAPKMIDDMSAEGFLGYAAKGKNGSFQQIVNATRGTRGSGAGAGGQQQGGAGGGIWGDDQVWSSMAPDQAKMMLGEYRAAHKEYMGARLKLAESGRSPEEIEAIIGPFQYDDRFVPPMYRKPPEAPPPMAGGDPNIPMRDPQQLAAQNASQPVFEQAAQQGQQWAQEAQLANSAHQALQEIRNPETPLNPTHVNAIKSYVDSELLKATPTPYARFTDFPVNSPERREAMAVAFENLPQEQKVHIMQMRQDLAEYLKRHKLIKE